MAADAYHKCYFCKEPFTVPCVCIRIIVQGTDKVHVGYLHFCPRCIDPDLDEESQMARVDILHREMMDSIFENREPITPGSA